MKITLFTFHEVIELHDETKSVRVPAIEQSYHLKKKFNDTSRIRTMLFDHILKRTARFLLRYVVSIILQKLAEYVDYKGHGKRTKFIFLLFFFIHLDR